MFSLFCFFSHFITYMMTQRMASYLLAGPVLGSRLSLFQVKASYYQCYI